MRANFPPSHFRPSAHFLTALKGGQSRSDDDTRVKVVKMDELESNNSLDFFCNTAQPIIWLKKKYFQKDPPQPQQQK